MTFGNAAADEESDEDSRALPLVADADSEDDSDEEDPDDDSGDDDPDDVEDSVADDDSAVLEPDGDVVVEDSVLAAAEPSVVSGAWLDGVVDDGDGVAEEDDGDGALVVAGVDVVGLLVAEVTGASR
ncbi:hypothetical protein [Mycolicibacterium hodleri]|uniref:hypothetical protein n=1 Tax=Mycolicibacterium hodleri TaxID=49897 RepID=UPI0021F250D5|nr:hypothetical protein [Mycolicibacterium hodleri]